MKNLLSTLSFTMFIGTILAIIGFVGISYYNMNRAIDIGFTIMIITIYIMLKQFQLHKLKIRIVNNLEDKVPIKSLKYLISMISSVTLFMLIYYFIISLFTMINITIMVPAMILWIFVFTVWHFYSNWEIKRFYEKHISHD